MSKTLIKKWNAFGDVIGGFFRGDSAVQISKRNGCEHGYDLGTSMVRGWIKRQNKIQNIWELLIRFNRCFLIDKINSSFQWKILGNCPLNFHKYMKTQKVAKKNSWSWKWNFFDREFVKSEKFVREFVNWKVTGAL